MDEHCTFMKEDRVRQKKEVKTEGRGTNRTLRSERINCEAPDNLTERQRQQSGGIQ